MTGTLFRLHNEDRYFSMKHLSYPGNNKDSPAKIVAL